MTRDDTLIARANQDEVLALRLLAKRERLKPSEMLRQLVRNEAAKFGLWPPVVPKLEGVQREHA